jgi:hypothetical protein
MFSPGRDLNDVAQTGNVTGMTTPGVASIPELTLLISSPASHPAGVSHGAGVMF